MAGSDQVFDKRLKRYPQLVPPKWNVPKWNVFDHIMLPPDEKRYLPAIEVRRGRGLK
jgi:hypothetical protein